MKKVFLLLVIITCVYTTQSLAQFSKFRSNPFSNALVVSIGAGVSQSETDYSNSDIGFNGTGMAEYFLSSSSKLFFGLKLEAGLTSLSGSTKSAFITNSFDTKAIAFGPSITANYNIDQKFFPYLGFGIQNIWHGNYKTLSINPEIGLRYIVSEYFAINGNVSFKFLTDDNLDKFIVPRSANDYFSTFTLSVSYSIDLSVSNDLDNDGIINEKDACPEQSEDIDGYEDTDGCPELDNDLDGIIDIEDNCPNEAEDFDGYEDSDGCPDIDNDNDGINDIDDSCPDLKEDFDNFEDNDGCPELDNDNDGIIDDKDKCPDIAETFNNYEDLDGCPDTLPAPKVFEEPEYIKEEAPTPKPDTKTEKKVRVSIPNEFFLEGESTFIGNSAHINSSAKLELNEIAHLMKSNPDFKWRIEAHLDNSGSPSELKELSTERAKAIMQYLVSKGLQKKSLQAIGLGAQFPIAPNSTIVGRLKNQRILIKRIR